MHNINVLIVDDDDLVKETLEKILRTLGYNTVVAGDAVTAINLASQQPIDIALLDYQLPDLNGIELMHRLKETMPNIISMVITGYGSIERAVEAMQAGAWDFITKPITVNILQEKLGRLQEYCILRREHDFHRKVLERNFEFPGIVGPSTAMQPVYEAVLRAAQSNLPILIEGETGTGKECIAKAIHMNSLRRDKPFVIMDCTATPQSLIESVLFGCSKGAFTGAIERKGLLKEADHGTLFMDEIGEITQEIQPKLLRCLETKKFRPLGSNKEVSSDFRIICATNKNLQEMTQDNSFRSDLFFRISAQKVSVPPLRQRPSDIPLFVRHFIKEIASEYQRENLDISPEALQRLSSHDWQGNIRQLKFVIETAFFNTLENRIGVEDIHLNGESHTIKEDQLFGLRPDTSIDLKTYREKVVFNAEQAYLKTLLDETQGDVRIAAKKAGLTREAFYRVMTRCKISPNEYRK